VLVAPLAVAAGQDKSPGQTGADMDVETELYIGLPGGRDNRPNPNKTASQSNHA
jgi:hypothetical protein